VKPLYVIQVSTQKEYPFNITPITCSIQFTVNNLLPAYKPYC